MERLDLSFFDNGISARGSDRSRATMDPKLPVSSWLDAAVDGAPGTSARKQAPQLRAAREQQERLGQALELLQEWQAARSHRKNNKKHRVKPVRVSHTDSQARKIQMADGGVRPAYNVQLATDPTSGAIAGVDFPNSPADSPQSGPLRE